MASLLEKMDFVFPLLVVRINGKLVNRIAYNITPVTSGDNVDVLHVASAG